ncbi:hypothetical protein DRJ22_01920 [Candidatus Woesearchaeota archaeon]|nr:MAG: hypothetical protein DRJ22_01920 [Candidatus Woesearchaeota archaeon]
MTKKEFHEGLVLFENSKIQLFVMRAPNLDLKPGKYNVTINNTDFDNLTIEEIKQKYKTLLFS